MNSISGIARWRVGLFFYLVLPTFFQQNGVGVDLVASIACWRHESSVLTIYLVVPGFTALQRMDPFFLLEISFLNFTVSSFE